MSDILTEEELKEWYEDTRELLPAVSEYRIKRLIGSNRSTLSANAELSFKNKAIQKKFDKSLEWLESIEKEFYHETDRELERCRSQAKCAREQLT